MFQLLTMNMQLPAEWFSLKLEDSQLKINIHNVSLLTLLDSMGQPLAD